jgi:hypothetical protein
MFEVSFDGSGKTPVLGRPIKLFDSKRSPAPTDDGRLVYIEDEKPAEGEQAPDTNGIILVENWIGRFADPR